MENQNEMPREEGIDHSLGLLKDGYQFMLKRRQELNSDIFETRLLGMKVLCMGGEEAATLFYDPEKFQRKSAAPNRVVQTLFGKNAVQTLDGEEHKRRKQMFISILTGEGLSKLTKIVEKQWENAIRKWEQQEQIILYEEVKELLCMSAFEWVGVPIKEEEMSQFTTDLGAMYESASKVGPKHWQGRTARNRVEQYLEGIIEDVRSGKLSLPENSVLHQFSSHRDHNGGLMEPITVAVEIINLLRPLVAVSVYINFIVLALHENPEIREKMNSGDAAQIDMFIQEVRRYYPFFPFTTALVKNDFTWNDYEFKKGTLAMLDLYGTNHDPKIWENPGQFNPERFNTREENHFDFIPQGGGDYKLGHRCPGEMATIEIMKASLKYVTKYMEYQMPEQDLSYSLIKMPSIPASKIVLENVKRIEKG